VAWFGGGFLLYIREPFSIQFNSIHSHQRSASGSSRGKKNQNKQTGQWHEKTKTTTTTSFKCARTVTALFVVDWSLFLFEIFPTNLEEEEKIPCFYYQSHCSCWVSEWVSKWEQEKLPLEMKWDINNILTSLSFNSVALVWLFISLSLSVSHLNPKINIFLRRRRRFIRSFFIIK
jgi:hypothetical protein